MNTKLMVLKPMSRDVHTMKGRVRAQLLNKKPDRFQTFAPPLGSTFLAHSSIDKDPLPVLDMRPVYRTALTMSHCMKNCVAFS